jgi:hypothetical protein
MPSSDEKLDALLGDLRAMGAFLHGRGEKTRALAQKFAENAQRDPANREYDLSQSRMLDYQHHVWHEIGNMVEKLVKQHEAKR